MSNSYTLVLLAAAAASLLCTLTPRGEKEPQPSIRFRWKRLRVAIADGFRRSFQETGGYMLIAAIREALRSRR